MLRPPGWLPFLAVLSVCLPLRAVDGTVATVVGSNTNASNQAGPQSETDIAIDPTNPSHLVGGSNDIASGNMRVYESTNGGSTWTNTALPLPASPFNAFTSDPAVSFDAAGNAYYALLGVNSTGSSTTLVVTKKASGAGSWGAYVTVPNVDGDKELMTVDRTGGTFNGNVYVAWDNNNATGQSLMVARSTNAGASFTAVKVNDSGTTVIGASPAIGPNGEVYVAWSNYASASHNVNVDRSTDGGVTWGTDHLIHHWAAATGSGLAVNIPADPQRGVPVFPFLDVDRSNGPARGTVYCVLNDQVTGNGFDVLLRKSTDGGVTWSAASRVNDDATGVVRDQFFPRVAVDDATGYVYVSWYDTRLDANNKQTNVYGTVSTDGGATFAANVKITTATSDESVAGADANGYGDYTGLAVHQGTARPLWTDRRTGSEEIFTAAFDPTLAAPTAANDGPVCAGGTIHLTATTVPFATYQWSGPNGFTSALQNPTIALVTAANAGTYSVTASRGGLTSSAGTTMVAVSADGVVPMVTAPTAATVTQTICQ